MNNQKQRILVVDDNSICLMYLQIELIALGYTVDTASDVESALKASSENLPDLLLTDIDLPDGNGAQIWQQLVKHKEIPAIAFSGHDERSIVEKTGTNFSGYLTKPLCFTTLSALISKLLLVTTP